MDIKNMKLNQTVTVCNRIVKNRIVVPPMVDFGMGESDGLVNERHIQRYRNYAEGGAGLVIIEACFISDMPVLRNGMELFDDHCLPGLSSLAQAAKANGAVSLVQLLNNGLRVMREESIAQISRENFQRYKKDFISAAIRCKNAGFDGVELHAAHGFYLNEIVETSNRNDEYGGSFENRVRILQELIAEIKSACGGEFIVAVRFGSRNVDELVLEAKAIEQAGGDLLDVSSGCSPYENIPRDFPFDGRVYAASLVKKYVRVPVICVGGILTGEQAEEILENGYADMVAVGRGHLAEPAWAKKVLAGEEPNPCRRCKKCLWYVDGRKCPAIKKKEEYL